LPDTPLVVIIIFIVTLCDNNAPVRADCGCVSFRFARCCSGGKSAAISAVYLLEWRNFRPAKKCCRGGNTNQGRPCPMSPCSCRRRAASPSPSARTRRHWISCLTSAITSRVGISTASLLVNPGKEDAKKSC